MRRGTETLVARELVAAPTPFEKALKKSIATAIRDMKRDGTVSISLDNLMQAVRPPSQSLEGAPRGTNSRYYYKEIFQEVAKDFRGFVKASERTAADAKKEYEDKAKAVKKLMDRLQKVLKKHESEFRKDEKDWGYVGDLGHVESELNDVVRFLRG